MKNITYLLGAGASANALPLIKKAGAKGKAGLPEELRGFINSNIDALSKFNHEWDPELIERLKQIAEKCIEFGTPDLYAKFLLEKGNDKSYKLLKRLLSHFFTYMQETKRCFDFRALTFLTTVMQNQKIPENLKVLSWNYDSQIEMAAEKLKPMKSLEDTRVKGFTCWPNCSEGEEISSNPFLVHLNGVAGWNYSKTKFAEKAERKLEFKSTENTESLLSFAWESESLHSKQTFFDQRLSTAEKIASETQILVVIGYSFPFFNREIDERIFNAMTASLQKIYYQDPNNNNGESLRSQFNLSPTVSNNIIPISYTENYHIPFEL